MEDSTVFFCSLPTALGTVGSNYSRKLSKATFLNTMWSHLGTFCVVKGIFICCDRWSPRQRLHGDTSLLWQPGMWERWAQEQREAKCNHGVEWILLHHVTGFGRKLSEDGKDVFIWYFEYWCFPQTILEIIWGAISFSCTYTVLCIM